jgi:uncharacterized protein (TIGR00255 family)
MSVYSMTGYAAVQQSAPQSPAGPESRGTPAQRLGLELRSVNSRFLDLSLRLPDELRQHEPALRELITRQVKRGKVELRASLESGSASPVAEPSPRLLQRLNAVQDSVRAWLPEAAPLSVADVIRFSSIDTTQSADPGQELIPLAQSAVSALLEAREREGARLASMLVDRLARLKELAQGAVPLVPQLVATQQARFLERWKDAMALADGAGSPDGARDRALTEATAFAIRIDVAEELTRLNSHLDEIARLVAKGGEIGKRLDFLIQELHREANTLGSKSASLEMTRISVDMKVLIEQMREQVQNIE